MGQSRISSVALMHIHYDIAVRPRQKGRFVFTDVSDETGIEEIAL